MGLQRDKVNAQATGNAELVEELDRKRVGGLSAVSFINDRNRKGNIERAMKGLKQEEIKNKKEGNTFDPFTRRVTRAAKHIPKEEEDPEKAAIKKEQEEKMRIQKENISKSEYTVPKKTPTEEVKPVKKEVTDIFNAHDFDIDID